jgi:hypothetical protein
MREGVVTVDERRLRAELPEFLELLEDVAGWVGGLDLAKVGEVPAEALSGLRDGLLRALGFLHELFALRGEPPPFPEPGIAFGSLGPSLRKSLPQRLAAQLADELNTVPGRRLEDVTQFTALGLHARISDLLRLVGFLEEERVSALRRVAAPTVVSTRVRRTALPKGASPAPPPPAVPAAAAGPAAPERSGPARLGPPVPRPGPPPSPAPNGPGPDLAAYDIRIDEAGERVDAGNATVWFAAAAGPRAAGEGLSASFAVPFPGGVVLAVADGAESSLGARLAAVVAVRAFCRAAAAQPSTSLEQALRAAQWHLDVLLSALLSAGDAAPSFARVRGSVPAGNARRILAHTKQPDPALQRVAPALATSLVGAVALAAEGGLSVSVVRLGPGLVDVRSSGRVTPLLGAPRAGSASFLAPGVRGAEEVSRFESLPPFRLSPGDAILVGTAALAKGSSGAWAGLSTLWPPFPDGLSRGDTARDLLGRAERWGETEPLHFAGPLAFALLRAGSP